jgi:hypothetical protein
MIQKIIYNANFLFHLQIYMREKKLRAEVLKRKQTCA